jgi:hypothetical protein
MANNLPSDEIRNIFEKELNKHGDPFQYAVVEKMKSLADEDFRKSMWIFEATELPVRVNGADTRIDIVLKKRGDAK